MKLKQLMFACVAIGMLATGCKEKQILPGNNDFNQDSIYVAPAMPDPEGFEIPEGTINVNEAIEICRGLDAGGTTAEEYYIKGWINILTDKNTSGIEDYGNADFYIGVSTQSQKKNSFYAYRVYAGENKKKVPSVAAVQVGDFVILRTKLKNYNGVAETGDNGYIYASSNPNFNAKEDPSKITPDPEGANVPDGCLNVYQARDICKGLADGAQTSEVYHVKGWIHKVASTASDVEQYGNGTFYISATNDGTTDSFDFEAYRIKYLNGGKFTSLDQMKVGDFVVLESKLKNYSGTFETGDGAKLYSSTNPNVK